MMGLGEVVVMMGAAAMMIGPKGMPNMARQAGRALGTAARMLKEGRAAISTFSKRTNLQRWVLPFSPHHPLTV